MDEAGQRLISRRLPEGLRGIRQLNRLIGQHVDEPDQVVAGSETDRGLWVGALVAVGYRVYAINPLAVARYRDRHHVSGANADGHRRLRVWRRSGLRRRDLGGLEPRRPGVVVVGSARRGADLLMDNSSYPCRSRFGSMAASRRAPIGAAEDSSSAARADASFAQPTSRVGDGQPVRALGSQERRRSRACQTAW
jgi:Transposase